MFCGECGAKNKNGDRFCSECGSTLQVVEEPKVEKNVQKSTKEKQPMSKKNKIILAVVAVVVVVLGVGYKLISDACSPKKIADDYIQAVLEQDADKLYKYLEIKDDKTFVSKKIYTELVGEQEEENQIQNYAITNIEYGEGKLSATVTYRYTKKDSSTESTGVIILTKQKGKKFLFFDDWKVNSGVDANLVENYTLKVPKGSVVTYAGVEVKDTYLDQEKSTDSLDVYVLPQVFAKSTVVKATLANGMELEQTVTPSSYYATQTIQFNQNSLSDATRDKMASTAKDVLTTLYSNAMAKKAFSDIKSSFQHDGLDLTDLEESYSSFVSSLTNATNTLTSISFTEVSLYSVSLNDDGNLKVRVKAKYNYSVKYKAYFSDEESTHDDSTYSYMTITLGYDKGNYYLVDADSLTTYFSRY